MKVSAAITGVGGYLPDYVLTNAILETMVDTSDEWIQTRTGIKERRILQGKDKGSSVLGTGAVKNLLEKTGADPLSVDCIICSTVTPDMQFPATAAAIARDTGLKNAFVLDVQSACSGFLYSLTMAASLIESGRYKKVILVGADKMSSIVDYTNRANCVLFGDAGGAVLLEATTEDYGVKTSLFKSDGEGVKYLDQIGGGSKRPASIATVLAKDHYIHQEGQTVFKYAVKGMADVSYDLMQECGLSSDDVAWLVPHQANLRIIEATAKRMGLPMSKVMVNIERYGNTTGGTIPLCLWDWENQLNKGDNLILAAFGGGFTWGATWVKWAYDGKNVKK